MTGPIYGEDKIAAMADSVCFCLPSRQEGFSIAIIEALACSTPAVITEGCHFPEVGQANAGRVVPLDARMVAEALLEIIRNPTLRDARERAGARTLHLAENRAADGGALREVFVRDQKQTDRERGIGFVTDGTRSENRRIPM